MNATSNHMIMLVMMGLEILLGHLGLRTNFQGDFNELVFV